jgi:NAD(P)-dependent dehydrogenase (short-subunit alcohol dehydrogenase family)
VLGVGPDRGIGAQLCHRFAREGLHVFVGGRSDDKVEAVAQAIRDRGCRATAVRADATQEADVVHLFQAVEEAGLDLEVAIYNAGNNMNGDLATMEASFFESCWRVACFGGFLFGREAVRRMLPRGKGSVIFTGASASWRGVPKMYPFTAAKAGLRVFAQAMNKEYGPQGLHVAHVIVDGAVEGDRILKGKPYIAEMKGEQGLVSIEGTVDAYWYLHSQHKQAWTFELDLRPFKEPW